MQAHGGGRKQLLKISQIVQRYGCYNSWLCKGQTYLLQNDLWKINNTGFNAAWETQAG